MTELIDGQSPNEEPESPLSKRLSSAMSVLILLTVLFFTLTTWEYDNNTNQANADFASAQFNFTQASIISQAQARQNYTTYSSYLVNQRLAEQLGGDETLAATYADLITEAGFLASYALYFFPSRYLNADGSYDFDRNAGELLAELGRRETLDSAPRRAAANRLVERRLMIGQGQLILGFALAILSLEEVFFWKRFLVRIPLAVLGTLLFLVGLALYLMLNPNPLATILG